MQFGVKGPNEVLGNKYKTGSKIRDLDSKYVLKFTWLFNYTEIIKANLIRTYLHHKMIS